MITNVNDADGSDMPEERAKSINSFSPDEMGKPASLGEDRPTIDGQPVDVNERLLANASRNGGLGAAAMPMGGMRPPRLSPQPMQTRPGVAPGGFAPYMGFGQGPMGGVQDRFYPHDDAMLGSPHYRVGIVNIERFFASYIDMLFTFIDQAMASNEKLAEVVVTDVILLAKDLRDLTVVQWKMHCGSSMGLRHPFFPKEAIPRLSPVMEGDFVAKQSLPLGVYLEDFSNHYNVRTDSDLKMLNSGVITVALGDMHPDTHYLVMPKHEVFLDAVLNSKLYTNGNI